MLTGSPSVFYAYAWGVGGVWREESEAKGMAGRQLHMDIQTEIANWSDHVLNSLITEEAISEEMRMLINCELLTREHPMPDVELNKATLAEMFKGSAPNAKQLAMLGLRSPLRSGWMQKLYGTRIKARVYAALLNCKGRKPPGITRREWRNATA